MGMAVLLALPPVGDTVLVTEGLGVVVGEGEWVPVAVPPVAVPATTVRDTEVEGVEVVDTLTLRVPPPPPPPPPPVPVKVVEALPSPPEDVVGGEEREGGPGLAVETFLGEAEPKDDGVAQRAGEAVGPSGVAVTEALGVPPPSEEGEGGEVRVAPPSKNGEPVGAAKEGEGVGDEEGVSIAPPGGEKVSKVDPEAPPIIRETVTEEEIVAAGAVKVPPTPECVGNCRVGELEREGEDVVEGLPDPPVGVSVIGGGGVVEGVEDKLPPTPPPPPAPEEGEVDREANKEALGFSVKLGALDAVKLREGREDTDPPPPPLPPSPPPPGVTEGESEPGW